MPRFLTAALLSGLIVSPITAAPAAGTWRLSFPIRGGTMTLLIQIDGADDKAKGKLLDSSPRLEEPPTVEAVTIEGDRILLHLRLSNQPASFDGRLPRTAGQKVLGSLLFGNALHLTSLQPSKLTSLEDRFALAREVFAQAGEGAEMFEAAVDLLRGASEHKLTEADVRQVAGKADQAAEAYGPRWRRVTATRMARALLGQEDFAAVALVQARQAERLLTDADPASDQLVTVDALTAALRAAGKSDEAKEMEARLAKLEAKDYETYRATSLGFKPQPFAGRKGKSDRVVLMELFTGTECPPCVAADLGADAVGMAYKPTEVVLLQYHEHIPGPDPLTSPDAEARFKYYSDLGDVRGTPTPVFSGRIGRPGGGPAALAEKKFEDYRTAIDELLEKPTGAKLTATATRKGGRITISAKAEVEKASPRTRLRFALIEERVRYAGGNGVRYHHAVVRAMPGGPEGLPLPKDGSEATVTVNLPELRQKLLGALAEFSKEEGHTFPEKPMALKDLKAVAFVQDDDTGEVLQAVQVDITE